MGSFTGRHAQARQCACLAPLACALLVGCGSGGNQGDAPSDPRANAYGDGARVHEIIGPATWLDPDDVESTSCVIPPDSSVRVTGVSVLALDAFDETGGGDTGNIYVQDAALPADGLYAGATTYGVGFSPPDLRVVPGDIVDLTGVFTEFPGPNVGKFEFCRTLPELSGTMEFRFEAAPSAPIVVPASVFASYEAARPYFGSLVTVQNLELIDNPYESNGRYSIRFFAAPGLMDAEIPSITNELMDLEARVVELTGNPKMVETEGLVLPAVTGIMTYFYGIHLAPRSADDVTM
jgi:hypothetical protein